MVVVETRWAMGARRGSASEKAGKAGRSSEGRGRGSVGGRGGFMRSQCRSTARTSQYSPLEVPSSADRNTVALKYNTSGSRIGGIRVGKLVSELKVHGPLAGGVVGRAPGGLDAGLSVGGGVGNGEAAAGGAVAAPEVGEGARGGLHDEAVEDGPAHRLQLHCKGAAWRRYRGEVGLGRRTGDVEVLSVAGRLEGEAEGRGLVGGAAVGRAAGAVRRASRQSPHLQSHLLPLSSPLGKEAEGERTWGSARRGPSQNMPVAQPTSCISISIRPKPSPHRPPTPILLPNGLAGFGILELGSPLDPLVTTDRAKLGIWRVSVWNPQDEARLPQKATLLPIRQVGLASPGPQVKGRGPAGIPSPMPR